MRFSLALLSLLALASSLPASVSAQRSRHADVWTFGTRCRLSWNADATVITPGTDPVISTAEGSATLSDPASGELLVSSDGVTVWDGAGAMVATGLEGHTSSMHSGIIIPRPLTPNRLFVITHSEHATATVAYREIDTTGPVTAVGSNVSVMLDGGMTTGREGMLLIQHANEVDYWLLVAGDGVVFVLPVTVDGIGAPVRVPTSVAVWTTGWNIFAASNAGDRLVISSNSSVEGLPRAIVSFDFDRRTGAISGRTELTSGLDREYYGGAFSPDDSKLYFSTLTSRMGSASTPQVSRVYQYDFDTRAFTVLDERMPIYSNGQARLGPDGRVYIATGTAPDTSVSVVENPNAAGTAATFRWGAIAMPSPCSPSLGLPQTVSPTAHLRFGIDILEPVGSHAASSATPSGTANVADGQTITVTVTGPGGFVDTCTAVVSMQRWSCADGSISGLSAGETYTITAQLSPTVTDRDTFTVVECFRDADCDGASQFCDTEMNRCVPRVPNGNRVPTIGGHDPTLDGMCTTAVGDATCVSRVCEASDDLCGYRNGLEGGPCTVANGAVVCRSAVCSPGDGHCGYRDGEGPCTAADGAIVCRSGLCGSDGLCRPTTGCDTDSDCVTETQYCDTPSHTCVPRVPNDMAVPTSPGHDPTLDGTCTPEAGEAACLSRLCEDDDLCGLRPGSTCASPVECRSFICAPLGVCGLCDDRTPCPTGEICNVPDGTCHAPDAGVTGDAGVPDGGVIDDGRPAGLVGGACGCSVRDDAPSRGWMLALAAIALAILRRRRG
jgi:MYXO-CTERM domain-containing protein